jgi:putative nucleotidyltransferase with HDIG domain
MTAGVLKVVNSSFFGLRTHVSSPLQAINLLGTETIKALVLSVHLFTRYVSDPGLSFDFEALWGHSLRVSVLCRTIAHLETSDARSVDLCSMAGLLHDVGKLVLACHFTKEYREVLATVRQENRTIHEVELALLGVTHAEVGAYLLGLWGLDEHVVEAVFHHHNPDRRTDPGFTALACVHAANALEHELRVINPNRAPHPLDLAWLEQRELSGRLPLWREACAKTCAEETQRGE